MEQLYLFLASLFQLAVTLWALYLILYHAFGGRFKYSPGQVLGLSIRALFKGIFTLLWWLCKAVVELVVQMAGALAGLDLRFTGSNGRPAASSETTVEGAHFLSGLARWRLLRRGNDGLVIDGVRRLSCDHSFRHLALIAPTGTGKTSAYVTPNLLKLRPGFSAVVTDLSGELHPLTSGELHRKGCEIKVFDVTAPDCSLQYNPLHRARTPSQIEELCDILIRAAFGTARGDQQFWNIGARTILSILMRRLQDEPAHFRNLHNVLHLLNLFGTDGRPLYGFVSKRADEQTFAAFKGFLSNSDKVIQGMLATARTALAPFADPELARLTAGESLHFETLRERPTVLYLSVPEHRMAYYGFLLSLFWTQFFNCCMEMPRANVPYTPIFCFLDEFGNVARIPNFEQLITTLRKRQVSVSIILQDVEQLVSVYGRSNASTILNGGCASQLYLPGLSHETCREIEQMLGRQTVTKDTREKTRPLLSADEIRTLGDREALLLHANKRPVLLRTRPYYKSLRLRSRARRVPAPHPTHEEATEVVFINPAPHVTPSRRDVVHAPQEVEGEPKDVERRSVGEDRAAVESPQEHESTNTRASSRKRNSDESEAESAMSVQTAASNDTRSETISRQPRWALELLQESRLARQEVEELREAIGTHDESRKETAKTSGVSDKKPRNQENEVVVLTPEQVRSLVKQAAQQGASESLRKVVGDLGQLREILQNQRGVLSKAQCMSLMEITSDTTYYQRCREGLPYYTVGKQRFHFLEEVMDWMRAASGNDASERKTS